MFDIGSLLERNLLMDGVKPFVEVEVMEKECTDIVTDFFNERLDSQYAEGSLEERLNIVITFMMRSSIQWELVLNWNLWICLPTSWAHTAIVLIQLV